MRILSARIFFLSLLAGKLTKIKPSLIIRGRAEQKFHLGVSKKKKYNW